MKFLILLIVATAALSFGCGKSKPEKNLPITDRLELYKTADLSTVPRCDSATFWTHAGAVGVKFDISTIEKVPGRIERHTNSCYPEGSRTSSSREMYIGWLHYIWTTKDFAALKRIKEYGNSNGWIFGEGPRDFVDMSPLIPIIYLMVNKMNLTEGNNLTFDDTLSGFKGHVLASYLWLWGRVNGQIGPLGMSTLRSLEAANPDDPMYQALLHRFTDGDFSLAKTILDNKDIFPEDRAPETKASFGWGSCPDWLYYLITDGIIRGI